jgi:uncharacterized protein
MNFFHMQTDLYSRHTQKRISVQEISEMSGCYEELKNVIDEIHKTYTKFNHLLEERNLPNDPAARADYVKQLQQAKADVAALLSLLTNRLKQD